MMIAIDGYEANVKKRVGISRYAYEIISHLYKISHNHQFRIYLPEEKLADLPSPKSGWEYCVRKPKKLWTFIGLPMALSMNKPKASVVFSPTHYIPRYTSVPRVMSIMDLSYLRYPELFKKKDLYKLQNWTRYSIAKAHKILTISEYTKDDIIKEYKIPEERVVVTYPGLSVQQSMNFKMSDVLRTKYGLHNPYILTVGTLQPRKNYIRLIEAFANIKNDSSKKNQNMQLVIIGKKGWLYQDILTAPVKFNVGDAVRFLDYVPDEDLPTFYRSALCFALPSLYEGFGLPVLEAMSHSCMVVVSKTSSLPEIAGSAGIYIDPESTFDITKGLLSAINENGTQAGVARVKKGLEHAKQFTWEKAAKKTLEVLETIGENKI